MNIPAPLEPIGETYNTKYYRVGRDTLVVMPDVGLKDDAASARVNVQFQVRYAESLGRPCGIVVVLSRLVAQDADARKIYSTAMDPKLFFATALVVGNAISRAIASFFMGLSRPLNPTRIVESVEAGIAWLDTQRPTAAVSS